MNEARATLALSVHCEWLKTSVGTQGFFMPRQPLSQDSFKQTINLGHKGYVLLSADGGVIGRALLRNDRRGIAIDVLGKSTIILPGQPVGDIELLYSPIRETRKDSGLAEYSEIHLRAIRLCSELPPSNAAVPQVHARSTVAPEVYGCVAPAHVGIDGLALSEALSEIRAYSFHSVSWVYFIKATGHDFLKIGVSKDPEERLKQFSTAAFDSLSLLAKVPGSSRLEHALHRIFAGRRANREWFRYDPTLQALVDAISTRDGTASSLGG